MNHTHHRAVRRTLPAAVAAGALGIALAAGSAAGQAVPPDPATIVMKLDGKNLRFTGPKQVAEGQELRIRNGTAAKRVGPHTFTLSTPRALPKTKRAIKRCFTRGRICMTAAIAHKFNPKTGKVARPLVKAGLDGWDKSFTRSAKSKGDTWYTEKKGETFSQVVSATAGTTLSYLCVVHPEMQGKIDVVQGAATPTP